MKTISARVWIPVTLVAGAFSISLISYAQGRGKPAQTNIPRPNVTNVPHSRKATRMLLPPEAVAERRVLYAQSERLAAEARALLASGDLSGAERAALGALAATPNVQGGIRPLHTLPLLLGDIYLREGKYEKALQWYLPSRQNVWRMGGGLNLDVALCYARLGNYEQARRFYSDQELLQYSSIHSEDLPGTDSPQALEASIQMARGMDAFLSGRKQEAFEDMGEAARLAPADGLIPYYQGMSLVHMGRYSETLPYFARAATFGHGKVARDSQSRIAGWPAQERQKAMQQAAQLQH